MPKLTDFWITAVSAIGFAILEYIFKHNLYVFFIPHCKEQKNLKERDMRSRKGCFSVYRMFYFMFAVAWGYAILKDQEYLPPSLGGSGDINTGWKNIKYAEHAPGMKLYSLVTMGYHVGGLISHFMHA